MTDPAVAAAAAKPDYAGTVAGFEGLYQVNFKVPNLPGGTPACNGLIDAHNGVYMAGGYVTENVNLAISIARKQYGYVSSFDFMGICVAAAH